MMKIDKMFKRSVISEELNFLITNRIPRIAFTHLMGWVSQIEHPLISKFGIWLWRHFADLNLQEARQQSFKSIHDCFIRELKPGSRAIDPNMDTMSSPCDGIVGEFGNISEGQLFQAKGFPYSLVDLLGNETDCHEWINGIYITIRITSSMYHRFHAPFDGEVQRIKYFSGDTWNVNPAALKRVEKLFCKNERALLEYEINNSQKTNKPFPASYKIGIIPVAAVLVASIKLHGIEPLLSTKYNGPAQIDCSLPFKKGQEMGWFQHGSTIIIFAPAGFKFIDSLSVGDNIKMGQGLIKLPT